MLIIFQALFFYVTLLSKTSTAVSINKCFKNDGKPVILESTTGKLMGSCEFITVNDNNPKEVKGGNVYSWKSVPYAEPPVGSLRFKRTVEKRPWNDILNATQWSNTCKQQNVAENDLEKEEDPDIHKSNDFSGFKMWVHDSNLTKESEDCLYLNIWIPLDAYLSVNYPQPTSTFQQQKPPILVFFHGGNTVQGTSSLDVYDPSTFVAATNTIVITVNYRLGIFGFLYLDDEFPGNQAIYDQNTALKWIKNNAEKLGGDPGKITLVGHGTGASLVGLHLLYRDSWHLYNNVILQSGTPFINTLKPISRGEASSRAKQVLSYINCANETSRLYEIAECAQQSDHVARAGTDFLNHGNDNSKISELFTFTLFPPVLDDEVLTDIPVKLFENGQFNKCPVLTGFNVDEGSILIAKSGLFNDIKKQPNISHANLVAFLNDYFKYYPSYPTKSNSLLINSILHEYTKLIRMHDEDSKQQGISYTLKKQNYFQTLNKIISDQMYICPAYKFADLIVKSNTNLYLYLYAHRLSATPWPSWFGAVHGDELAFTFGHTIASQMRDNDLTSSSNPWSNPKHRYTNLEKLLGSEIVSDWANFARFDTPNKPNKPKLWPEYTLYDSSEDNFNNYLNFSLTGRYIIFKTNGTKTQRGFSLEVCQFWNSYLSDFLEENENLVKEKLKLKLMESSASPSAATACLPSPNAKVSILNNDGDVISSAPNQRDIEMTNNTKKTYNLNSFINLVISFIFINLINFS